MFPFDTLLLQLSDQSLAINALAAIQYFLSTSPPSSHCVLTVLGILSLRSVAIGLHLLSAFDEKS